MTFVGAMQFGLRMNSGHLGTDAVYIDRTRGVRRAVGTRDVRGTVRRTVRTFGAVVWARDV